MPSVSSRIALLVDGASLYATAKALGIDVDFKRLLGEFQTRGNLLRANYYTATIDDGNSSSNRPLIDWLGYNGYTVVTRTTKGRRRLKGDIDIDLAIDAMEIGEHIDQMVLFSGNGNLKSLVEAMQRRGVRVTIISSVSTQPSVIADELRRQADVFTDLIDLRSKVGRDPSERPAPRDSRRIGRNFQ